jgi:4-amino-4-deoxy-L-arabinose transferase-like glycosyltransferase
MGKKKNRKTSSRLSERDDDLQRRSEAPLNEGKYSLLRLFGGRKAAALLIIACVVIACLLPFAGKAFNMDDPMFIWVADQIRIHPGDLYGFQINWYDTDLPVHKIQKNPPLVSFYIAAVQMLGGSGEWPLHLAFTLITLLTALGMYTLAAAFCSRPLLAAFIGIMTPAFLVSANTVMSDMMLLCFWVWAAVFWIKGVETEKHLCFIISAILICLSTLSKYYGFSLVPLLLAYSYADDRTLNKRNLYLLIPIAVLCLYGWAMQRLYGYNHFLEVFSYAQETQTNIGANYLSNIFSSLAFAGGGLASTIFFWPHTWKRTTILWAVLTVLLFLLAVFVPLVKHLSLQGLEGKNHLLLAQWALFAAVGVSIVTLSAADFAHHRNAPSLFLSLWIVGTFIFAFFFNWTISVRVILPMAPAVGILIARRIEWNAEFLTPARQKWLVLPVLMSAALAMSVAWADYRLANTTKEAANAIAEKYISAKRTLWFQGHWGFQYYLAKQGGKPIDFRRPEIVAGDIIVTPSPYQNTNITPFPADMIKFVETMQFRPCRWLSVMNGKSGAGFYSSIWGPVPFAFGPAPPEIYEIAVFGRR